MQRHVILGCGKGNLKSIQYEQCIYLTSVHFQNEYVDRMIAVHGF